MSRHSSLSAKRRFFFTLTFVLLLFASWSLIDAQDQNPKRTTVNHKVKISKTGADDEDTIVYDGDTIEFCPATSGLQFSIVFTKSPFLPLGSGKLNFDDRSCGHPETAALAAKDHARAYDYVLAVDKLYFDPHVIIMPGKR
jgi:hypothetical protein